MAAPVPVAKRRQIVERHQAGESLATLSRELHIPYETVRGVWRHWRQSGRLEPNYEQAKQTGTRKHAQAQALALEMKQAHPSWGAELIRVELQSQHPDLFLPSTRTLQRWFARAGLKVKAPVRQVRNAVVQRGQSAHQVWAVDAKERMTLANGQLSCWLLVSDEGSGSALHAVAFPPRQHRPGGG